MKTPLRQLPRSEHGSTLLIVMGTVILLGIALASVLGLTMQEHRVLARTAAWNAALPAAESGVEEALSHLRQVGAGNRATNGWVGSGANVILSRTLTQSQFATAISQDTLPTITSVGYVWCPSAGKNIERTIRVTTLSKGTFTKALVTEDLLKMAGQTSVDSFDSSDPLYSTGGLYDASKRKDNGDIASNKNVPGSIDFSGNSVTIYGSVATGPDGTVIMSGGAVGSTNFIDSGKTGIETNRYAKDLNVSFPKVEAPYVSGSTPVGGKVGGVTYKYILQDGIDYQLSTLNLSGSDVVLVQGKARLLVDKDIKFSGGSFMQIATNASVEVYLKAGTVAMGGGSVANLSGAAGNMSLFGLPAVTAIDLAGGGTFLGTMYAPQAKLTMSGGGGSVLDFTGAAIVKAMDANGHYKFHYDEALGRRTSRKLIITSWKEL